MLDGMSVASIRDAGADRRPRGEAALAEAEAKYRSLVEQIPAVVYADDGNVTTYVNPQIERDPGRDAGRSIATIPNSG